MRPIVAVAQTFFRGGKVDRNKQADGSEANRSRILIGSRGGGMLWPVEKARAETVLVPV